MNDAYRIYIRKIILLLKKKKHTHHYRITIHSLCSESKNVSQGIAAIHSQLYQSITYK